MKCLDCEKPLEDQITYGTGRCESCYEIFDKITKDKPIVRCKVCRKPLKGLETEQGYHNACEEYAKRLWVYTR